jgi:hypothetical protein
MGLAWPQEQDGVYKGGARHPVTVPHPHLQIDTQSAHPHYQSPVQDEVLRRCCRPVTRSWVSAYYRPARPH